MARQETSAEADISNVLSIRHYETCIQPLAQCSAHRIWVRNSLDLASLLIIITDQVYGGCCPLSVVGQLVWRGGSACTLNMVGNVLVDLSV